MQYGHTLDRQADGAGRQGEGTRRRTAKGKVVWSTTTRGPCQQYRQTDRQTVTPLGKGVQSASEARCMMVPKVVVGVVIKRCKMLVEKEVDR